MLSVHSEQLHKTGFPTVHALILLEGTMNLTGEMQPLVEQLMMVKRMQVGMAKQGGYSHLGKEGGSWYLDSLVDHRCQSHTVLPSDLQILVLS